MSTGGTLPRDVLNEMSSAEQMSQYRKEHPIIYTVKRVFHACTFGKLKK